MKIDELFEKSPEAFRTSLEDFRRVVSIIGSLQKLLKLSEDKWKTKGDACCFSNQLISEEQNKTVFFFQTFRFSKLAFEKFPHVYSFQITLEIV